MERATASVWHLWVEHAIAICVSGDYALSFAVRTRPTSHASKQESW